MQVMYINMFPNTILSIGRISHAFLKDINNNPNYSKDIIFELCKVFKNGRI